MRVSSIRILLISMLVLGLAACAAQPSKAKRVEAARLNTTMGVDYAKQGQLSAALDRLKRAIDQDPGYPAAQAAIAWVYQTQGEARLAERHYRRALSLDPDDPLLKNNFGTFLCAQGRAEEGERYLLEAIRDPRYPTPVAAWTNAGLCFKDRDEEKAERYLREALRVDPQARDALAQLAVLSFRKQDYLRTRAFLQRYDLQVSATSELLYLAARTEAALGDTNGASVFEARLLKEFPLSTEAATVRTQSR